MSPWAWKALIWTLEIPACFPPSMTTLHSLFPAPEPLIHGEEASSVVCPPDRWHKSRSFECRNWIISKGMWDLLSTQFGKPQGLVETGRKRKWGLLSRTICGAQSMSFKCDTLACHLRSKVPDSSPLGAPRQKTLRARHRSRYNWLTRSISAECCEFPEAPGIIGWGGKDSGQGHTLWTSWGAYYRVYYPEIRDMTPVSSCQLFMPIAWFNKLPFPVC